MSRNRVARAGMYSIGGTSIQLLVQLVNLVVLARLLTPDQFGVYAMAMTFIGFTAIFRDLGLSSAAIQVKELHGQVRTNLWWINTAVGAVLATVALAAAPLIGDFFGESDVALVVVFMAPTLLLAGATAQYQASLVRAMRFGTIVTIDVCGAVLGLAVSLAVALNGGGVWALILPQLVSGVFSLVGFALASPWWPGVPRHGAGTRSLLSFGGAIFGSQILTYVHRNYDALLMGRLHGAFWTGQFNRATQMTRMPIGMLSRPFGQMALATMAPRQDDRRALGGLARHGQILLALPVLIAAGGLVAAAEPLVRLVLGPGWGSAVPFVRLVAASEALALMASVGGWILTSQGLGKRLIQLGLISTGVKLTLVSVGASWGPYGLVAGVVGAQLVLWPLSLVLAGRMAAVATREILLDSYVLVVVVGAASAAGWFMLRTGILPEYPLLEIVGAGGTMVLVLVFGLVVPPFRRDVHTFVSTVRRGLS